MQSRYTGPSSHEYLLSGCDSVCLGIRLAVPTLLAAPSSLATSFQTSRGLGIRLIIALPQLAAFVPHVIFFSYSLSLFKCACVDLVARV